MNEALIPPAFLFRLSTPCTHTDLLWSDGGAELDEKYVIPNFNAELNGGPHYADLRLGWSEKGLLVNLRTTSKKQAPWCRESRLEDSDGLSLFIDTRDTKNIHRASRFCHRFILCPQGSGKLLDEPTAKLVAIHRSREDPKSPPPNSLQIRSEKRIDGYIVKAFISSKALTGFDPDEHTQIGFSYAIFDREVGVQSFSLGPEYPFTSDPSLWGSLELV